MNRGQQQIVRVLRFGPGLDDAGELWRPWGALIRERSQWIAVVLPADASAYAVNVLRQDPYLHRRGVRRGVSPIGYGTNGIIAVCALAYLGGALLTGNFVRGVFFAAGAFIVADVVVRRRRASAQRSIDRVALVELDTWTAEVWASRVTEDGWPLPDDQRSAGGLEVLLDAVMAFEQAATPVAAEAARWRMTEALPPLEYNPVSDGQMWRFLP